MFPVQRSFKDDQRLSSFNNQGKKTRTIHQGFERNNADDGQLHVHLM